MKKIIILILSLTICGCVDKEQSKASVEVAEPKMADQNEIASPPSKTEVNEFLEAWHKAAADADFEAYFGKMADSSIYIGTDATEIWNIDEFKAFSKPYFDRGTAWDFTSLDRNIYFSDSGSTAWFDELLDTHMGLTRGSGVLTRINDTWKIKHYVLSLTIPNDKLEQVKAVNREADSSLIAGLKQVSNSDQ